MGTSGHSPGGTPGNGTGAVRGAGLILLVAFLLAGAPSPAGAQGREWIGRVSARLLSVEDSDDWLELSQRAGVRWPDGRRLEGGVTQTRRFGAWDVSLEAGGTLRPTDRIFLSLDGRFTPDAEVLEDVQAGTRAAIQLGAFVPSLGYRFRSFDEGDVHTVSPRLEWYRGRWIASGEFRVIRSAVETVNVAAIGRVSRRLSGHWTAWIGLAAGEEDFLVGPPRDQRLRTLTTRSLFGGVERRISPAWTLRIDLSGVDSDPRLDRFGGSLAVTRTF